MSGPASRWARRAGVLCALLATGPARAYETDQLTWRERPLLDALEPANTEMDVLLDEAIRWTNDETRCRADDDRTRRVLGRRVYRLTSANRWVWSRGVSRAPGFGVYSKWMETDPRLDRIAFSEREDFFGDLSFWDAVILKLAGPCSTFMVAGVRLGSDKLDHFLDLGFDYWKRSHWGEDPERAVRIGTRTENSIYGWSTSRTFSFADLRANWDGYRFYVGLLEPGSVIVRDEDGCVRRARSWDWAEYVDWHYDEVLYPPVFVPRVQERIDETLAARADALCAALPVWAPEGWEALREAHPVDRSAPWIGEKAPLSADPFRLHELCAPVGPAGARTGE